MSDWSERVDQLLLDGEVVEERRDVGTASVAITSHRVLAFTPQAEGADFRAIDRPNVRGVERRQESRLDLVPTATRIGAVGVLLAAVGILVDPAALLPRPDVSDAPGAGGMVGTIDGVIGFFHALDGILLAVGGLVLAVALLLVGLQIATREDQVAITVAGEESDVHLPGSIDDSDVDALEDAIAPQPSADVDSTDGDADGADVGTATGGADADSANVEPDATDAESRAE